MALQTTINHLKDLLGKITSDLHKAEGGNKAASQRVRTMTVRLEKVAKGYRKDSISNEKGTKSPRKTTKKAHKTTKAKPKAKIHAKPALKAKPKAKSAVARPRAFSFKKPTAKIPTRRPSFR